ncbi:hypothetical protein ACFL20_10755 [Spirochaetota bacterium]
MVEALLKSVDNYLNIDAGTVIVRKSKDKEQQGCFLNYDEDDDMIIINVIDIKENTLLAREGVLRPTKDDKIYCFDTSFKNSPKSEEALEIIKKWPPYKKNEKLQTGIINFVKRTYVPEQIIELKKRDLLKQVFIPVQQMFRIGRFKERRSPQRVCREKFQFWLDSMQPGEHLTYIACIMQQKGYDPSFYTVGTKPHEITEGLLKNETFNFIPTHGGHIKALKAKGGKKRFNVDAGSNYLGRGVKTPFHVAKSAAEALKRVYSKYDFTPLEGRGAFGEEQSY